jgi:DNA repair exonuclease SbcCD nuclease subunit
MVKVIVWSDFHAHIYETFAKPDKEFINDRFRIQIETLQKVFNLARKHKAINLFVGDLFHKRSKLDDIVFNKVYEVFAKNEDILTFLVRGNHDSRTNDTYSQHWLETFQYLKHVTVFASPKDGPYTINDLTIYPIPYSDDVNYLQSCIDYFATEAKMDNKHSILAAHIGVDGSETGKYSHRLEGAFQVSDLHPDVFDFIALGHYHKRQFLGGRQNVFYCGNTIQTSFADEGQEKGVFLIDTDRPFEIPLFIPIENKQFITLDHIPENVQDIVDNNYVRFILPQSLATEVEVFKELNDNIRVEVQKEYITETRIDIKVDNTEEEIVGAYTKEFYPEATNLALDILKEARAAQ